MVSPQATQDSKSLHPRQGDDESVRITADIRRQVLREHYAEKLERQQAAVTLERGVRNSNAGGTPVYTQADLRVSNMIAVLQDISSTLAAYADDNREFGASAVTR